MPSVKTISNALAADPTLPKILYRILRQMLWKIYFCYLKWNRKSLSIEKEKNLWWHCKFLRTMRQLGSDSSFLKDGSFCFESKKCGDYHEDMNTEIFEQSKMYAPCSGRRGAWDLDVCVDVIVKSRIISLGAAYNKSDTSKFSDGDSN